MRSPEKKKYRILWLVGQTKRFTWSLIMISIGLVYVANSFSQTSSLDQEQFVKLISGQHFSLYYPNEKAVAIQTPRADMSDQIVFNKDGTLDINNRKDDLNYWRFKAQTTVLQIEIARKQCLYYAIVNKDSSFTLLPIEEEDSRCKKWLLVKAVLPDKLN